MYMCVSPILRSAMMIARQEAYRIESTTFDLPWRLLPGIVCVVFLPMIVNPFLAPAVLHASQTLGGCLFRMDLSNPEPEPLHRLPSLCKTLTKPRSPKLNS